ncbi:carbohydrate esterase family 4 protein [Dioszegia hungarica]|uniref:chitin deacetylase n=1 Tax=Dioszegia hungarica TaxID=4972 RepID=A0AA38H572_9TREE|nr:carbohydrate esterase family 4 protein [Dioszegia hungarica]KAI9633116.1 carbohydrate esterase family 4 protein [Dioszegia hungarica]
MIAALLSLLLVAAPAPAVAHAGCGGHELIVPRQMAAPTDVASQSQIKDPQQQCTPYQYPRIAAIQANYPTIWQTATIPAADTAARELFARINATVNEKLPNAGLKPAAGPPGLPNYDRSDPDCWWTWQGCSTPNPSLGIPADVVRIPEPNSLGMTVDDGPNCSQNAFYDFLREQNQKVSMYYIGSNVMIWPLQAMRGHQDGHEICVHTWSHQAMTSLTNEQVFAELYYTRQIIKDLMGFTSRCWRPPQGDVDNRVRLIAAGLNLTNILWIEDSNDWRANVAGSAVTPADVDRRYQGVIDQAKGGNYSTQGTILLSHQSTNYTMSTLMKWLPQLKAAFAHVVPVASGMNWTTPYAESNFTYPSFAQIIANQSASAPGSVSASGPSASVSIGGNNAAASGSVTGTASRSGAPSGSGAGSAASSSRAAGWRSSEVGTGGVVLAAVLAWAAL